MARITIMIEDIPPSLNRFAGRQNAAQYRRLKEEWTERVCFLARCVRPPVPYEKAVVRIHYTFPDRRRRDPDNYAGKMLLDGLTQAGMIADDSFQHIELVLSAEVKPKTKKTEIYIEEAEK